MVRAVQCGCGPASLRKLLHSSCASSPGFQLLDEASRALARMVRACAEAAEPRTARSARASTPRSRRAGRSKPAGDRHGARECSRRAPLQSCPRSRAPANHPEVALRSRPPLRRAPARPPAGTRAVRGRAQGPMLRRGDATAPRPTVLRTRRSRPGALGRARRGSSSRSAVRCSAPRLGDPFPRACSSDALGRGLRGSAEGPGRGSKRGRGSNRGRNRCGSGREAAPGAQWAR